MHAGFLCSADISGGIIDEQRITGIQLPLSEQLPEGIGGGLSESQLVGIAGEAKDCVEIGIAQIAPANIFKTGIMNGVGIGEEVHVMVLRD
jgi:hypothetical protein